MRIFKQKKKCKKHSQTRRKSAPQTPPRNFKTKQAPQSQLKKNCRKPGSFCESEGHHPQAISDSFFEFQKNENCENTKIGARKIGP